MYSEKRDGGLSAARVRRIHGVLSSALNCAVRWRLVGHNVCKEVNPPRVHPPTIRPLSGEEARRSLEAPAKDRFHALYALGITTGARIGESGGLFWSDVDTEHRVLRIQRSLVTGRGGQSLEPPKTANSLRTVGLSAGAVEAVERHREHQANGGLRVGGDSLVFTNGTGKRAPVPLSLSLSSISWVPRDSINHELSCKRKVLAGGCSVGYKAPNLAGGGALQVLLLLVFIVAVAFGAWFFSYGLSIVRDQSSETDLEPQVPDAQREAA